LGNIWPNNIAKKYCVNRANLLDTNLIIRFLTEDDPKKARAVFKLFSSGKTFFLPDMAFAEIVWVLSSFYEFKREEIYEKIKSLLAFEKVSCNRRLLLQSLEYYRDFNYLNFVDCYLAALVQTKKSKVLYSYDIGFDKVKGIKRVEP